MARQIAILQTAFLGDTLLSIPLAKSLNNGKNRLALICRQNYAGFFLATRLFETVIEIEKGKSDSYRAAQDNLNIWWANSEARILLSPHESPRSKMFAMGMRIKGEATATVGYGDRGFVVGPSFAAYSDRIARPMELPETLRQLALLQGKTFSESTLWRDRMVEFARSQGMAGGRDSIGGLLEVPDWASMKVASLASEAREKTAILTPGSVWKTKQWTRQGFIEIGRKFIEAGRAVTLAGTKEEAVLCQEIALEIGEGAFSTAGETSLLETAQQMAKAEIAIVNDSGAMHLAAVTDTPVVAVFGPTILDFGYRPWTNKARVVEPRPLACRPCGLHGSQVCPIGTHICMTMTEADTVWRQVQSLIKI
jgi:heptosyltransferase-2